MAQQPNYAIQAPNATAVNILRSWLTAVGIGNAPSKVPGFDLDIAKPDGGLLNVGLYLDAPTDMDTSVLHGIQIKAKDFTGKKIAEALAAFNQVTDAAGYERAQPLDRGAEPEKNEKGNPRKLHYRDEEFLVTIRHTEFRRSPNPPKDRWEKYRRTMTITSLAFHRNNRALCIRHGLDIEDLMSYSRIWTVNFCSRYETPTPKHYDNERKLFAYLQQRFSNDLRSVLLKKERSTIPDAETVSLALFSQPFLPESVDPFREGAVEEIDHEYIERNCELDVSTPTARRNSAAKKLEELLGQLDHDRLVEVLQETAQSYFFDMTTRKEASRRLKDHIEQCSACGAEPDPNIIEGEATLIEEEETPMTDVQEAQDTTPQIAATSTVPTDPVTEKLDGKILPQADVLSTLRGLVQQVAGGVKETEQLATALDISTRQVAYYKHAASILGLLGTLEGQTLLGTVEGSQEEAEAFGAAVRGSTSLTNFKWFFDDGGTKQILAAFITQNYKLSESTAARRADCLIRWRKVFTSSDLGVKEDKDLTSGDAPSV